MGDSQELLQKLVSDEALKAVTELDMSPEEQLDIPKDFATFGSLKVDSANGKTARQILYNTLNEKASEIGQRKIAALKAMNEDAPLTKSQTAAMLLIGLLPVLAGGAVKGKKGLSIGAEAGALGATTAAKGFDIANKRKQNAAVLDYKSTAAEEKAVNDLKGKALLDEVNAADTAEQKNADRQQSAINAEIRAGGDAAVGKALTNVGKELENNRKATEASARGRPITFGGKVYVADNVTDDERKKVSEINPKYKSAEKNLTEMYRLSKNLDLPALQRMWQDDSSELSLRRKDLVNALTSIKEVPGRGGEYQAKRIEQMVVDPTSFFKNIKSQLPGKTGIPDSIATAKKLLHEDADNFYTSNGYGKGIPLGQPKVINGQVQYFIGLDKEGNVITTPDKSKVQDILDSMDE